MTPGTRKISLYFLMACAVVLSIVSVETVSSRLGHAIVPVQLEAVNRTAKGNRLSRADFAEAVVRSGKTSRLAHAPAKSVVAAANRTAKADRLIRHTAPQTVARSGKTAPLAAVFVLRTEPAVEPAVRLAEARPLSQAAEPELVARSQKTDSLKLIFAELRSVPEPAKVSAAKPAPRTEQSGVVAQGGPLVFVPVTVPLDRLTNVVAEPIGPGGPSKTIWN